MLVKSPELLDGLIEIAQHRKWFDTSVAAIKFSQCLVQGLWSSADPFLQLPFLSEEDLKKIRGTAVTASGGKGSSSSSSSSSSAAAVPVKSFAQFLRLSDSEKKSRIESSISKEEEKKEFLSVCSLFPRLKIETKLFVEEEEEEEEEDEPNNHNHDHDHHQNNNTAVKGDQIFEQDLVTLRIILTRENLPDTKNSVAAPVYAPFFPATLYENWWVVVADKSHKGHNHGPPGKGGAGADHGPVIHAFEKISDQKRVVKHDVKFYAPGKEGKYEIDLELYSDSYLGLDEVITIPFEVHPASSLPVYQPHPEDLELDNEPTVFEQLMANNQDESSEEEDDDEDEDEGEEQKKRKTMIAAAATNKGNNQQNNKTGKGKKKATRVIEEVEDEDD
jgi:translocation protein SEC63